MDGFDAYTHAIAALAIMGVLVLLIGPVSALKKQATGLASGATPPEDYANSAYRWHRAHGNASENLAIFATVTVAAILAGASPFWVNWLASIFIVARALMLVLHVGGIGRTNIGPRSFAFVAGALCCYGLAGLALVAAFGA
ncbi:MAPEG family protein [Roseovarius sp. LXJ103]|uniref:MAPEG family protein n=1 Tax=Roseovarius carneus TaxID=2853164 RepID=UPI000D6172A5|nr:MAPEG family protein [Roseovarius carneus]MBZ8119640.1 MAPEG family protein [Roseovarius carneus]PWE34745.1 hypothetical protein DD563_01345 [Pelagicola sp. LXJ1103]